MAVSKRTRFEVLRRDTYTCRYCRATDAPLRIDHVMPVALGGSDKPDNLVAACQDCNAGKSSASPDADTVAQVADDAVRWAAAREKVLAQRAEDHQAMRTRGDNFAHVWGDHDPSGQYLPVDADESLARWASLGITSSEMHRAMDISWARASIRRDSKWAYMCGVINNWVRDIEESTSEALSQSWADLAEDGSADERDRAWELNDAPHRLLCNVIEGSYDYLRDAFHDFSERRTDLREVAA